MNSKKILIILSGPLVALSLGLIFALVGIYAESSSNKIKSVKVQVVEPATPIAKHSYKIVCLEGYEYILLSYALAPRFDEQGKLIKCYVEQVEE